VVRRWLPHAVLCLLLVGAATAFVHAERLKLRRATVGTPQVRQVFSPGCESRSCKPVARLSFVLRRPETVSARHGYGSHGTARTAVAGAPATACTALRSTSGTPRER
jgi:hypothetical protein